MFYEVRPRLDIYIYKTFDINTQDALRLKERKRYNIACLYHNLLNNFLSIYARLAVIFEKIKDTRLLIVLFCYAFLKSHNNLK